MAIRLAIAIFFEHYQLLFVKSLKQFRIYVL